MPEELPAVEAVHDYQQDDLGFISVNLNPDVREYLQDDDGVLSITDERVKVLTFEDGNTGFLIVHGEPCYFDLICGNRRFSMAEQTVTPY